jgi:hypothetical protein
MLQKGSYITKANDKLYDISIDMFVEHIKNPPPHTIELIEQLRRVQQINPNRYRELKVKLPYICAARFHPPYRKKENFASAKYFILDVDHLSEKKLNPHALKEKLKNDNQIFLMFESPSGDGLKILFRFNEKVFDAGKYTLFYKYFAINFSKKYQLNQLLDKTTSDVSRACFFSYDPHLRINHNAEWININDYINFSNPAEAEEAEQWLKEDKQKEQITEAKIQKNQIDNDSLLAIKKKLNPNYREKKPKNYFVPKVLEKIEKDITANVEKYSIRVQEIRNINYGKKYIFAYENKIAELNIFFGKKGYSVVKSTKRGTSEELCDIVFQLCCEYLYSDNTPNPINEYD